MMMRWCLLKHFPHEALSYGVTLWLKWKLKLAGMVQVEMLRKRWALSSAICIQWFLRQEMQTVRIIVYIDTLMLIDALPS
jgi:hypothetical protein